MRLTFRAVDDRRYNISHLPYNKSHRQFRHVALKPLCGRGSARLSTDLPPNLSPQHGLLHLLSPPGPMSLTFTLQISHLRGTFSLTSDTSTLTLHALTY
jgi:hypothetical protein